MKYVKWMIMSLMLVTLIACTNDTENNAEQEGAAETATATENKPPIEVEESLKEIDWSVSETFESGSYTMRGVPDKVGFIDAPFKEGEANKYMWHFWGDLPEGELTVIALKEGSMNPTQALVHGNETVWTYSTPAGPNNGADAHTASNMMLPERGKWALLVYLGKEYFGTIVVEVE